MRCNANSLRRDVDVDKTSGKSGMAVYPVFHNPYMLPLPLLKNLIC